MIRNNCETLRNDVHALLVHGIERDDLGAFRDFHVRRAVIVGIAGIHVKAEDWLRTKQARSEASPCTGLLLFEGETIDTSAPTENWTGVEMPKRWAMPALRAL